MPRRRSLSGFIPSAIGTGFVMRDLATLAAVETIVCRLFPRRHEAGSSRPLRFK
jgi:hypothetical protein